MVYRGKYTTAGGPQRYCPRCDRAYGIEENDQIENWAWKYRNGEWVSQTGRK